MTPKTDTRSRLADRKQREAEQRRKEIIKVVRKLAKKGGSGDITLRKVAEQAGFSTTVVYSLFKDKATLITQAMDDHLLDLAHAMRTATAGLADPLERIRACGQAYVRYGMRYPDQYVMVFMERRPHAPVDRARVEHGNIEQDPYAFAHHLFAGLAASGAVRGDPASVLLMTQIFWEALHGLVSLRLVLGEDDPWLQRADIETHLQHSLDVVLADILHRYAA